MENEHLSRLFGGGFWGIPKEMVKVLGIEESFWIFYLYEFRMMLLNKGDIKEKESFSVSQERIQQDSKISPEKQNLFIQKAIDNGYLRIERKGLPCRIFYELDPIRLMEFIYAGNGENPSSRKSGNLFPQGRSTTEEMDDSQLPQIRELAPANPVTINTKEPSYKEPFISSKDETGDGPARPMIHNSSGIRINRPYVPPQNPIKKPSTILSEEEFMMLPGYTKEAKEALLYWNALPKHSGSHRLDPSSKTFIESLEAADRAINRGATLNIICNAMDNFAKILNLDHPRYARTNAALSVGMADFFEPKPYIREKMDIMELRFKSWFLECSKNQWLTLEDRYSKEYPNKYPDVTEALKQEWPGERREFTIREENILRKTAERLYNYFVTLKDFKSDLTYNKTYPYTCVKFLWRLLAEKKSFDFGSVPYWIQSPDFFVESMGPYLKEIGYVVDGWDSYRLGQIEEEKRKDFGRQEREEQERAAALGNSDFL